MSQFHDADIIVWAREGDDDVAGEAGARGDPRRAAASPALDSPAGAALADQHPPSPSALSTSDDALAAGGIVSSLMVRLLGVQGRSGEGASPSAAGAADGAAARAHEDSGPGVKRPRPDSSGHVGGQDSSGGIRSDSCNEQSRKRPRLGSGGGGVASAAATGSTGSGLMLNLMKQLEEAFVARHSKPLGQEGAGSLDFEGAGGLEGLASPPRLAQAAVAAVSGNPALALLEAARSPLAASHSDTSASTKEAALELLARTSARLAALSGSGASGSGKEGGGDPSARALDFGASTDSGGTGTSTVPANPAAPASLLDDDDFAALMEEDEEEAARSAPVAAAAPAPAPAPQLLSDEDIAQLLDDIDELAAVMCSPKCSKTSPQALVVTGNVVAANPAAPAPIAAAAAAAAVAPVPTAASNVCVDDLVQCLATKVLDRVGAAAAAAKGEGGGVGAPQPATPVAATAASQRRGAAGVAPWWAALPFAPGSLLTPPASASASASASPPLWRSRAVIAPDTPRSGASPGTPPPIPGASVARILGTLADPSTACIFEGGAPATPSAGPAFLRLLVVGAMELGPAKAPQRRTGHPPQGPPLPPSQLPLEPVTQRLIVGLYLDVEKAGGVGGSTPAGRRVAPVVVLQRGMWIGEENAPAAGDILHCVAVHQDEPVSIGSATGAGAAAVPWAPFAAAAAAAAAPGGNAASAAARRALAAYARDPRLRALALGQLLAGVHGATSPAAVPPEVAGSHVLAALGAVPPAALAHLQSCFAALGDHSGASSATLPPVIVIDNASNACVLHPDTLVAPTRMTQAVWCMRRAVLQDTIGEAGGGEAYSKAALMGRLKHELFQAGVRQAAAASVSSSGGGSVVPLQVTRSMLVASLRVHAHTLLQQPEVWQEMLHLDTGDSPAALRAELLGSAPAIADWICTYVLPPGALPPLSADGPSAEHVRLPEFLTRRTVGLETEMSSPVWGIKGIVDATVETEWVVPADHAAFGAVVARADYGSLARDRAAITAALPPGVATPTAPRALFSPAFPHGSRLVHTLRATVPLELKTGRRDVKSASLDHRAQVLVYSLLMSQVSGGGGGGRGQGQRLGEAGALWASPLLQLEWPLPLVPALPPPPAFTATSVPVASGGSGLARGPSVTPALPPVLRDQNASSVPPQHSWPARKAGAVSRLLSEAARLAAAAAAAPRYRSRGIERAALLPPLSLGELYKALAPSGLLVYILPPSQQPLLLTDNGAAAVLSTQAATDAARSGHLSEVIAASWMEQRGLIIQRNAYASATVRARAAMAGGELMGLPSPLLQEGSTRDAGLPPLLDSYRICAKCPAFVACAASYVCREVEPPSSSSPAPSSTVPELPLPPGFPPELQAMWRQGTSALWSTPASVAYVSKWLKLVDEEAAASARAQRQKRGGGALSDAPAATAPTSRGASGGPRSLDMEDAVPLSSAAVGAGTQEVPTIAADRWLQLRRLDARTNVWCSSATSLAHEGAGSSEASADPDGSAGVGGLVLLAEVLHTLAAPHPVPAAPSTATAAALNTSTDSDSALLALLEEEDEEGGSGVGAPAPAPAPTPSLNALLADLAARLGDVALQSRLTKLVAWPPSPSSASPLLDASAAAAVAGPAPTVPPASTGADIVLLTGEAYHRLAGALKAGSEVSLAAILAKNAAAGGGSSSSKRPSLRSLGLAEGGAVYLSGDARTTGTTAATALSFDPVTTTCLLHGIVTCVSECVVVVRVGDTSIRTRHADLLAPWAWLLPSPAPAPFAWRLDTDEMAPSFRVVKDNLIRLVLGRTIVWEDDESRPDDEGAGGGAACGSGAGAGDATVLLGNNASTSLNDSDLQLLALMEEEDGGAAAAPAPAPRPPAAAASPASPGPLAAVRLGDASSLPELPPELTALGVGAGDVKRRLLLIDGAAPRFKAQDRIPVPWGYEALPRRALEPGAAVVPPSLGLPVPDALASDFYTRLNDDQRTAVLRVLTARDWAGLLGMPGTGKTSTVTFLIRCLIAMRQSVLVTSYTHTAVDTLLGKVVEAGVPVLRLGNRANVAPALRHACLETLVESGATPTLDALQAHLWSTPVVGVTCLGVRHPLLSQRRFDWAIVDEASQITEPVVLGPLRCCKTFVLVGDPMQLPPLVVSPSARAGGLATSLLERLFAAHPTAVVALRTQYRMNGPIQSISNRLVYNNALRCGSPAVEAARYALPLLGLLPPPRLSVRSGAAPPLVDWLRQALDLSTAVLFLDTDGMRPGGSAALEARSVARVAEWDVRAGVASSTQAVPEVAVVAAAGSSKGNDSGSRAAARSSTTENGFSNPVEAALVATLVMALCLSGAPPSDIAVISPYRAHLTLLRRAIAAVWPALTACVRERRATGGASAVSGWDGSGSSLDVETDTVDRFQGQDKPIVLLSLVRSNPGGEVGTLLADRARLNVALTRAKHKMVILGSGSTLQEGCPLTASLMEVLRSSGWVRGIPAAFQGVAFASAADGVHVTSLPAASYPYPLTVPWLCLAGARAIPPMPPPASVQERQAAAALASQAVLEDEGTSLLTSDDASLLALLEEGDD